MRRIMLMPGTKFGKLDAADEAISKRLSKVDEALDEPLTEVVEALVVGTVMSDGLDFRDGGDLAWFVLNSTKFCVAVMQEQGYLPKTLPKAKKPKESEGHPGHYL